MMGGFTQQVRNPDSWEGWYWGAKHVWGQGFQGMMSPAANLIKDISEHCDLVLKWGCDEETTPWGFTGQYASRISPVLDAGRHQAGLHLPRPELRRRRPRRQVDPGAAEHRRGPAAGHHLRVAHRGHLGQGVRRHPRGRHGQDRGLRPGQERTVFPKTPDWASKKCGVPEWTIKALARQFAKNTTSIIHYFGGSAFRGPYSHEPGRLECVLLGMQGLGGPGVHQCQMTYVGMPRAEGLESIRFFNPDLPQRLTKTLLDHRPRLGPAAHSQDPDSGSHPQRSAGLPR